MNLGTTQPLDTAQPRICKTATLFDRRIFSNSCLSKELRLASKELARFLERY